MKKLVKDNWKYDKEGDFYHEGKLLRLTGPPYYECVIGMEKSKVIKLFGKPNEEKGNRLIYYEGPLCHENSSICSNLSFIFDKNGKVSSFSFQPMQIKNIDYIPK